MNLIGFLILAALVFEFVLHRLSEALNLRSASALVPAAFKELYDSTRYARAQDYLRARTRFAWISSGVFLAATIAFWLGGGFGLLDGGVRSLGHGPILSGLIYVGALWIGRSIIAVPFQAYTVFVIEERFGFNRTNFRTFLADGVKALVLSVLIGAPLLAGVLALFEHAGPWAWLYGWALAVFFMAGIQFVTPRFILPLFNKFEAFFVEQPSVYAGLVLFSLLLRPFDLLLSLLLNRVSRSHELEADRFAVETTNDRNALVSALKKLSADNLSNLSPHPLHVALSYSHPPIQQRIRSIENIPAASRVSIETPDRTRKN
jgi:hypothetical protein